MTVRYGPSRTSPPAVVLRAKRDIYPGEEITFAYWDCNALNMVRKSVINRRMSTDTKDNQEREDDLENEIGYTKGGAVHVQLYTMHRLDNGTADNNNDGSGIEYGAG